MLIIGSSCRPSKRDELEADINLLLEHFGDKYPICIETFGPWDDYFNSTIRDQAIKNLKDLMPKNEFSKISVHAPFASSEADSYRDFFMGPNFLREDRFRTIIDFAQDLNASVINFHASSILSYDECQILYVGNSLEQFRRKEIAWKKRVFNSISSILRGFPYKICVENLTNVMNSDKALDPVKALYAVDCVDLSDLAEIADPDNDIYATVDVCHLACSRDSSKLLDEIKSLGDKLGHIHFSDLGRIWTPFLTISKEGEIPGRGFIGERVGKELFAYFLEFSRTRDLIINLEIANKDFLRLDESRESFKIVRQWLDELSA